MENNIPLFNMPSNLCITKQYADAVEWALARLPENIKKKLPNFLWAITDMNNSKDPFIKINDEVLGYVQVKERKIIYLTKKYGIYSDDAVKGLIIHEIAHSYIGKYPNLFRNFLFRWKFSRLQPNNKPKHFEELYANWLVVRWGFKKEIEAFVKESNSI